MHRSKLSKSGVKGNQFFYNFFIVKKINNKKNNEIIINKAKFSLIKKIYTMCPHFDGYHYDYEWILQELLY